eukprot:TRINITY_DN758_c0_g1_i1.p1 TRINITY_DN758_c0_g1~~TRINITY_DN758_c0_g1_i1.p1  ORF type:complete len:565 (-),score=99.33 TRINITY_DN758_c0_g1_i1:122-1816(-)
MMASRLYLLLAFSSSALCALPELLVVDLGLHTPQPLLPTKLAALTCAGLFNRLPGTPAYTMVIPEDESWLNDTHNGSFDVHVLPVNDFLQRCLQEPVSAGYIRYNWTAQAPAVPNLITLAGVLRAVPLEDSMLQALNTSADMAFDAATVWSGFGEYEATEWVFEQYGNQTTGLAKMNPGFDTHTHPLNPPLTGSPHLGFTDYIVKARIFNFFLAQSCLPGTKQHALMQRMLDNSPFWKKPAEVYGYDDSVDPGGSLPLFESETLCAKTHGLGLACTDDVNNLAFYSRTARVTSPVTQNPDPSPAAPFNASRTYITLVVGDGDNTAYIKTTRYQWFKQRVARCKQDPTYLGCFPLVWTISPHTLYLAPDWLGWYLEQSKLTGQDYFVLPPSGHLYAYPSLMQPEDMAQFVNDTERDCQLLNTSGSVAWELTGTWGKAMEDYFPKYAQRDITRGFFAVNVPFMLPVLAFPKGEFYRLLDSKTVVFKPHEWRGTTKEPYPFSEASSVPPSEMARQINAYPPGTVTNIYLTSDGGADLSTLYDLVPLLDGHVQVVNHNVLVEMARQRG